MFLILRKFLTIYLITLYLPSFGQNIVSWNLKDLGKSRNDSEIKFIASLIKGFDIIAIQEVVAGYGGPQAVARLADQLNRTGSKWDYTISNPTSSSAYKTERYAFIWKTNKVQKVGKAWLENKYGQLIDREPYYCRFRVADKVFTLVNFHAITKSKQPETEVKYFKFLPAQYPKDNLIFCGDFNLPQSHTVFIPLRKMGYKPALVGQKTTLKQKKVYGNSLASEFDNIFYKADQVKMLKSGIIPFYKSFKDLSDARFISDHVPIYFQFSLN